MFSAAYKKRLATAMAGAALASALVVSGASADPHAIDAAAREADPPAVAPAPHQDLRSPDTRDQAEGYSPTLASQPVVDEPSEPGGFDLVSAAIGAAAGTGVVIVLLAAGGIARRRPLTRRHGTARA
jgi:hypothetical protein